MRTAALIALTLAGAFLVSALAVDWRQDSTDLGPLATDVAKLQGDLEEVKIALGQVALGLATPREPFATPSPQPTPQYIEARAEAGTVVDWSGLRFTIERVEFSSPGGGLFAYTFENVANPSSSSTGPARIVDAEGFVCVVTRETHAIGLLPGEKGRAEVEFSCEHPPRTLTIYQVRFRFDFGPGIPTAPR